MLKDIGDSLIITRECRETFLAMEGRGSDPLTRAAICMAGVSRLSEGYAVSRFRPGYHVVLATLSGSASLGAGGRTLSIEPATLTILPAGFDYTYAAREEGWRMVWFHLRRRTRWKHLESDGIRVIPCGEVALLDTLASVYIEESGLGRDEEAGLIAQVLTRTLDRLLSSEGPGGDEMEERMTRLMRAIESDLRHEWTVREMAALAHLSPQHFQRMAIRYWGLPPMRAVTRARMNQANLLLRHTRLRISEIALLVGYSDQFAFSTAYHREKGTSPSRERDGVGE